MDWRSCLHKEEKGLLSWVLTGRWDLGRSGLADCVSGGENIPLLQQTQLDACAT